MEAVPGRPRGTSLVRALAWFVVSYGLAVVGYAAANAVAGRWFGKESYGLFVVVVTVSAAIGQLGLLGTHRGGLRAAAQGDGELDDATLRLLRADAAVASRLSLPLAGVLSGVVMFLVADADTPTRVALGVGFALLVLFSGQQKLWANYLRGLGHVRQASLLEGRSGGAVVSFTQAVLLLLAWKLAPQLGLAGAVGALVLGFAVPVMAAGRIVHQRLAPVAATELELFRNLPGAVRRNWRFAANQLALYIAGTVEIWIAGVVLTSEAGSEFAAAQRLGATAIHLVPGRTPALRVQRRFVAGDDTTLQPSDVDDLTRDLLFSDHRERLRRAMEAEGFAVYEHEWWHFDFHTWREYPVGNEPL